NQQLPPALVRAPAWRARDRCKSSSSHPLWARVQALCRSHVSPDETPSGRKAPRRESDKQVETSYPPRWRASEIELPSDAFHPGLGIRARFRVSVVENLFGTVVVLLDGRIQIPYRFVRTPGIELDLGFKGVMVLECGVGTGLRRVAQGY